MYILYYTILYTTYSTLCKFYNYNFNFNYIMKWQSGKSVYCNSNSNENTEYWVLIFSELSCRLPMRRWLTNSCKLHEPFPAWSFWSSDSIEALICRTNDRAQISKRPVPEQAESSWIFFGRHRHQSNTWSFPNAEAKAFSWSCGAWRENECRTTGKYFLWTQAAKTKTKTAATSTTTCHE